MCEISRLVMLISVMIPLSGITKSENTVATLFEGIVTGMSVLA